ncbi:hypothetical protein D3D03_16080 [Exiguobacterium sp. RIT452]|uniref:hypothetical protein n=1 Tax=unclassified Exiguobacterium TaxID=2644629 RepID=UPI000B5894F5|nr:MULTISPECIES: hypothetical protein [unclassified Exiguobacterium]ASI36854.1 hypothetical protein A0126_15065 [Exiguobacterium sp. N4-1P]ASI37627.1 hypothetical protein A0126_18745 [Exiguobacterium sp. N4-1P]RJO94974.1 hypothetical protein D3D03_16080 [Exiguobacterium sp. RIT452]
MTELTRTERVQRELRVIATIIKENKKRLRRGEVLNIQTQDGFLVVFEEEDPDSGDRKTVTLIDTFDFRVHVSNDDLTGPEQVSS